VLLAVSIPLSEFGMSISQFFLLGIWLFDLRNISIKHPDAAYAKRFVLNITEKFRMFFNNPAAVVVVSLYLMHVAGLIYTTDLNYALKDLRIKLPLISLPVIIATTEPLKPERFTRLLIFFVLAVFAGTMASMYMLITTHVADPREISIFISHIRFGLTICLSVFILIYFIVNKKYNRKISLAVIVSGILWFLMFLLILESVTGIAITLLLGLIFLFYYIFRFRSIIFKILVASFLLLTVFLSWQYINIVINNYSYPEKVDLASLDRYTKLGHPYVHDTSTYGIENGKYVGLYINFFELKREWEKRSEIKFEGRDHKGQELQYTLIRYLNSKDLRKDAEGVRSLSNEEINHIENGIANVRYIERFNLSSRFEQMAMGYINYINHGNPNASSVMQRVEYWKASAYIIKKHWLTGVGTGDLNLAFEKAYLSLDSRLESAFRNRSHNQFLAIFIAFGIGGLILFLFSLVYPGLKTGKFYNYLYIVFFIIIFMSMLTEDTLETQAGATFFAFFNALLLFGCRRNQLVKTKPETFSPSK
jgi:O-antigen ligase